MCNFRNVLKAEDVTLTVAESFQIAKENESSEETTINSVTQSNINSVVSFEFIYYVKFINLNNCHI